MDLEALRAVLADRRVTIAKALVDEVEVSADLSKARALVRVLPDENEAVAEIGWSATGPSAGHFALPVAGDLVLVAMDSNDSELYVIARLTSDEDKIPLAAKLGHHVIRTLSGKNLELSAAGAAYLLGNGNVYIGKGEFPGIDPDQPVVLGTVLQSYLTDLHAKLDSIIDTLKTSPTGIDSVGGQVAAHPSLIAALTTTKTELSAMKSFYIDSAASGILSESIFVER